MSGMIITKEDLRDIRQTAMKSMRDDGGGKILSEKKQKQYLISTHKKENMKNPEDYDLMIEHLMKNWRKSKYLAKITTYLYNEDCYNSVIYLQKLFDEMIELMDTIKILVEKNRITEQDYLKQTEMGMEIYNVIKEDVEYLKSKQVDEVEDNVLTWEYHGIKFWRGQVHNGVRVLYQYLGERQEGDEVELRIVGYYDVRTDKCVYNDYDSDLDDVVGEVILLTE